ncbi:MAG: LuxR C-terminal-related transcriptional regulator, partial [Verrucomicrobiota bacterium]
ADDLGLSVRTVSNHRTNISAKLGLSGVHSLVKFAFENRSRF